MYTEAEQFAADELGFTNVNDAQIKSPKLFSKIVEQYMINLQTNLEDLDELN